MHTITIRFNLGGFMRYAVILISLCTLLVVAPQARTALPITTIAGVAPTTAPAPPTSVMLLPFHAIGQSGDNVWVSQAIEEDLAHDLSRNTAIRVVRPATTQPMSASDNLDAARQASAPQMISGSYQIVDDQLRITGEVTDVNSNNSLGQIKATGHLRDLFQLEDALAEQLWRILPRPVEDASASDIQVTPLADYLNGQQPVAPAVNQSADSQPPVVYESAPDDLGYPYASYGYGYPFGYGYPVFIYGGFGHGGFHHGGGHIGPINRFSGGATFASPHMTPFHFAPAASGGHFAGGHR
jgi:TolB-like protein